MFSRLIPLSAIFCLFTILFLLLRPRALSSQPTPFSSSSSSQNMQAEPGSVTEWFLRTPYTGSWRGWWNPHGKSWSHWFSHHHHDGDGGAGAGWNKNGWNVLYHVGGNGPWIEMRDGIASQAIGPPPSCTVEQVHLMSRHHERFPTKNAGARILGMLDRLKAAEPPLKGPLAFVDAWEYITDDPASHHEQLTTTGPFAGVLAAFTTGVKLRTRYAHLLPVLQNRSQNQKAFDVNAATSPAPTRTTLWASDSERVIATAQHFAAGFFGLDALSPNSTSRTPAQLVIIPETPDLGADTLTPGDTCPLYRSDTLHGHDQGVAKLAAWRAVYLPAIAARLAAAAGSERLSVEDVYAMQELCGFELTVRGASPWCALFSPREWAGFEYARDLQHFYRSGGGNRYARAMGWLWLNATAGLLGRPVGERGNGAVFASFVHDGDVVPMLAALDLFPEDVEAGAMSVATRDPGRNWRASQIVPMGGRVVFEKLVCEGREEGGWDYDDEDLAHEHEHEHDADYDDDDDPEEHDDEHATDSRMHRRRTAPEPRRYVRINVNDGIVALPTCAHGPGHSCPLDDFLALVERRGVEAGGFEEVCGLPLGEGAQRGRITFLHQ